MSHPPRAVSERQLEQLYGDYNRLIFALFTNAGFSVDEARDLVQETFLAAHRSWAQFEGRSSHKTWLIGIAKRIGSGTYRDRSRLKRKAKLVPLDEAWTDDTEGTPARHGDPSSDRPQQRLLRDERNRLLWNALEELPTQMRRMVILRLAQSLKYKEIAETLQVSVGTVRSQLFEARGKLRERLAEHFSNVSF